MTSRMVFGAALAAVSLCAPAAAAVDAVVAQALALHGRGDAAGAFALLAPLERTRAGDADYDYALGLAAADSGRTGIALRALQRVIAVQPENAQARAEIARVYALAGDAESASAAFDTVVADPSVPDPVRQRIDGLIKRLDRDASGRTRSLTAFADLEGGYDSNVNAATSATTITLPAFAFLGPATLGGGATRVGAGFVQAQAGISGTTGLSRQTGIYGSVLGLWRDALDSSQFDQAALTGTAGVTHSFLNRDVISLSGQVQGFWLARDPYRTSYAAIGQYTHRLTEGAALSLSVQYAWLDYTRDKLRSADRVTATVAYTGRRVFANVGGGTERPRDAAGRHLGFDFASLNAGFELPVANRMAVTGSAGIEYRGYRDADPLFLGKRRDWQADASLGVRYALTDKLSVRPRVTYTRTDSNFALYSYDRITASVALRIEY